MNVLEDCARGLLAFSQEMRGGNRPWGDGTQLLELRDALESAFRLTDSMRNERIPVNQLPPEILLYVFGLTDVPQPKKSFSQTLVFSLVCKHWRSVVISNPLLWTNISAGPLTQPEFITLQLKRSGNLPLTLSIQLFHSLRCSCGPDPFFDGAHFCPHGNERDFSQFLDFFTPYLHRIVTLNVRYLQYCGNESCEDVLKHRFFRDPLPSLERLYWVSRNITKPHKIFVLAPTTIFSDSLPRLKELVLVNTWGLISTAGPNLHTLKVQYLGDVHRPDAVVPVPGLQRFLSRHPLLTSVSLGDIHPEADEDGGGPIEMRHLTNVALTSRRMDSDIGPTFRCLRFGTLGHMETLIIRREIVDYSDGSIHFMLKMTWVDKNGHNISCSFADDEFDPLEVWGALCEAGVCDGVTAVELKRPHVRSATSKYLTSLFEDGLPHLRTIRMAWGGTTAEEVEYSGIMCDYPPPDVYWAASYLMPILRCRAAVGKPVHLVERIGEDDKDPTDSRRNDRVWEQYLYKPYNLQQYLK